MVEKVTSPAVDHERQQANTERELRIHRLADRVNHFRRRWRPADPEDRDQFERDLTYLVHAVQIEMTQAFGEAHARHVMASPFPPSIFQVKP